MTNHRSDNNEASSCPCCGPGSLTVGLARAALTGEAVTEILGKMTYRPFYYLGDAPMIVLVHQQENRAVLSWLLDEAHELLHAIDAGPVAATLCLGTNDPDESVQLSGDEICAFAIVIETNLLIRR